MLNAVENAPEGLFEQIEKEPEDKCLYRRLFLDYTYGSGSIYTSKEIKQASSGSNEPIRYAEKSDRLMKGQII